MNNPPNDDIGKKPVTAERQKILNDAMKQLKATRGEMDPSIFGKIRSIIANNPKVMKALGLSKLPNRAAMTKSAKKPEPAKPFNADDVEKIDQEKNLDIIAKFMTIKPSGREGIKTIIKKTQEEKLKEK